MRAARFALLLLFVWLAAHSAAAQARFSGWAPLGRYERIALGEGGSLRIAIPTREREVEIAFTPERILADGYGAELIDRHGMRRGGVAPELAAYTGRVEDNSGRDFAKLSISRRDQKISGLVRIDGVFYELGANLARGDYLLNVREVTRAEVGALMSACGVDTGELLADPAAATSGSAATATSPVTAAATTQLREIELGTEADAPFVSVSGGATNANARLLAIVNMVNGIYEADLGLTNRVVVQRTHTGSDPYTTTVPEDLLEQFRAQFLSSVAAQYDDAMLFTGRNLDGQSIGIAWVGETCTSYRFGLIQLYVNDYHMSLIAAHELGHNLGAVHTTSGLMAPTIDPAVNTFSQISKDQIASYVASVGCLSLLAVNGNQPPVLQPVGPQLVAEGQLLSIQLQASDPDGDAITYAAAPLPAGATLTPEGLFEWMPERTAAGCNTSRDYYVQFRATDTGGLSANETVPISVSDVQTNAAPIFIDPADRAGRVGQVVQVQLQATDDDGDQLLFTSSSLPAGATLSATGTFSWTPSASQQGPVTIPFRVQDCTGLAATQDVQIDVAAAPVTAKAKKKKGGCGLLGIEAPILLGLCVIARGKRGRRAYRRMFPRADAAEPCAR